MLDGDVILALQWRHLSTSNQRAVGLRLFDFYLDLVWENKFESKLCSYWRGSDSIQNWVLKTTHEEANEIPSTPNDNQFIPVEYWHTGQRSAVGNMSGNICDRLIYRYRGRKFNPGRVPYFRGDWSWNNFYGHTPPFRWIIQEGLLSVSLPRKKVWLGELTVPTWPWLLTRDIKQQNKRTKQKHTWIVSDFTDILCCYY